MASPRQGDSGSNGGGSVGSRALEAAVASEFEDLLGGGDNPRGSGDLSVGEEDILGSCDGRLWQR